MTFNDLKLCKDEIVAQLVVIKNGPTRPEKKFMLFAKGRSGSGLLRSLLNSHPDIFCDNEVFNRRKAIAPKRYLLNCSNIRPVKVYGYKAKIWQLDQQYQSSRKVFKKFFTDDFQIIYLRRRNFFRQAISNLIGNERGIWHDTQSGSLSGQKFKIDCKVLLERIEWLENWDEKEKEVLKNVEYLHISYEDDLLPQENHQKTLNRIFKYLGVHEVPVQTKLVKTTSRNLADFIRNYDEVVNTIKNSRFEELLNMD